MKNDAAANGKVR